jgi:hypothetical protein
MEQEYTKEFFWSIYQKLPEDLKEAIFSEENNKTVNSICSKYNLNEDQISLAAKYTGRVLMGLLPLKDFSVTMELELNIDEETANQLSKDLHSSIFKHYTVSLDKLNGVAKNLNNSDEKNGSVVDKKEKNIIIEKTNAEEKTSDPYRESLE